MPDFATVYNEAGWGNPAFLSHEIEFSNGREERTHGWIRAQFVSVYLRFWIGKRVVIVDTKEGIKLSEKQENHLKILVGWVGKLDKSP